MKKKTCTGITHISVFQQVPRPFHTPAFPQQKKSAKLEPRTKTLEPGSEVASFHPNNNSEVIFMTVVTKTGKQRRMKHVRF